MKRVLIIFSAIISMLYSCESNDIEQTYIKQEAGIDSYISRQFADMPVTRRNGSNRITVDTLDISHVTDSLVFGDSLFFYYAGYVFNNQPTSIFSTNVQEIAEQAKLDLTAPDFSIKKVLYGPDTFIDGLNNGLYGVKDREHCIIVFSGKYGFGDKAMVNIPKNSALAYEIWVEKIIKN